MYVKLDPPFGKIERDERGEPGGYFHETAPAPGKLADIVVMDRNLLRVGPDELRGARVRLTMVDGRVVYEDGRS